MEDFAALIIKVYENKPKSFAADYLIRQLIRPSCSAALNFGENLGASSDKDKANKLRIVLKELRESISNISIQSKAFLFEEEVLIKLKKENDELIRIVVTILKRY